MKTASEVGFSKIMNYFQIISLTMRVQNHNAGGRRETHYRVIRALVLNRYVFLWKGTYTKWSINSNKSLHKSSITVNRCPFTVIASNRTSQKLYFQKYFTSFSGSTQGFHLQFHLVNLPSNFKYIVRIHAVFTVKELLYCPWINTLIKTTLNMNCVIISECASIFHCLYFHDFIFGLKEDGNS